ncbi:MAG: preprotein translocase subunit SecE [Deltaproteobacteria bacterium]|nr:MAG: preprotein translocase subunit SecE [Deltaproteobacteria bacterium]
MTKKKVRKAQSRNKTQAVTQGNDKPVKSHSSSQASGRADAGPALSGGVMGWVDKVKSFLLEVRVEFDKITWPSRKEAIALTTAVLAITFFFTAYLGLVDISLTKFVSFLIY